MWHATTNRSTVFVTCRPAAAISKKSYRWSLERRLPLRPRSLEAGGNWRISKPTIDRIDADIFESFRLTVLYVYIFGTQEAETYDHLHFFLYNQSIWFLVCVHIIFKSLLYIQLVWERVRSLEKGIPNLVPVRYQTFCRTVHSSFRNRWWPRDRKKTSLIRSTTVSPAFDSIRKIGHQQQVLHTNENGERRHVPSEE